MSGNPPGARAISAAPARSSRLRLSQRAAIVSGCTILLGGLFLILGFALFGGKQPVASHQVPTASARVVRTDVVERQQVSGTLDYRGSFLVANAGQEGVITWLPTAGSIVRRGQPLFELDREPVPLLYGDRPAYRSFTLGMSGGPDIRELQQNLLALGFDARGALAPSGRLDLPTLVAIEEWQRSLELPVTGSVPLGSVIFLPSAVRIKSSPIVAGASVQSGDSILLATATQPAVLVALDPGSVAQLRVGDRVRVTMPNSTTTSGRVTNIGRVATVPGSDNGGQTASTPTLPVTIGLLDPHSAGALDQAPVQVAITTQADRNVLAVPISALLAQPGGGYAVQVENGATTRLLTVTTGLFDEVAGRVEVSGAGLAPGMRVEVPAQ
jgi:peptidoglycan hydrolase-like protein with peptidoglycan-binding domain